MIIGISGKMGTGKTTLARHIAELRGGRVMSFADELRAEVSTMFDIPVKTLFSRDCKENMTVAMGQRRMTIRELLQWWGALRREHCACYWVDRLVDNVDADELVIVDDVRYHNEACAIRSIGGQVFRLDPYDEWRAGVGSDHPSETDLDDGFAFDWRSAPPFGTLDKLAIQLAALI